MASKKMSKSKKSQITMFVIVGLVLVIIVVITLALVKFLKPKPVDTASIINELETGRIKNHITNCIMEVSHDAIDKLGANGGVIYDYEGGTIPRISQSIGSDYLNYTYLNKNYMVMYGLKKNTVCDIVNYSSDGYPIHNQFFSDYNAAFTPCKFTTPYSLHEGFFGQSTMKRLCYSIRPATGCESFATGIKLGLTVQRQMEQYIAEYLPECVDFSAFVQRMPVTITADSSPVVETTIHQSDILVMVKYPVTIRFEGKEPIKRLLNYQSTINARLGLLYNFLFTALALDSESAAFDIENQFIVSPYYKPGLNLKKIPAPCDGCEMPEKHDNLVEVVDHESFIKGKPLIFRVAVENRRPALDFIPDQVIDLKDTQEINIQLKGYDPDESRVRYAFFTYGIGLSECQGSGNYVPPLAGQGVVPGGKEVLPPITSLAGHGWCENDPRITASLADSIIWAPISASDSGTHKAGVLVVDETGMFSFRQFWINIIDTSANNPFDMNACVKPCIVYSCSVYGGCVCANASQWVPGDDFENHFNCEQSSTDLLNWNHQPYVDGCMNDWCSFAANQCSDVCSGGRFASGQNTEQDECWKCVDMIVNSATPHEAVDCTALGYDSSGAACIAAMPDCFWVLENVSSTFVPSCLDHNALSYVQHPAYILTQPS